MKHESLKNKFVMITGIFAGLFVLALLIFSPSQNASALSVKDEVYWRMTEAVDESNHSFTVEVVVAVDEKENGIPEEGYVLSEEETKRFYSEELPHDPTVETIQQTATPQKADESIVVKPEENEQNEGLSSQQDQDTENFEANNENTKMEDSSNTDAAIDSTSLNEGQNDLNPDDVDDGGSESSDITQNLISDDHRYVDNEELESLVTATPRPTNTPEVAPTLIPTLEPTLVPTEEPDIFWLAGFETGDISEWQAHGDWLRQGNTGSYEVQNEYVHTGGNAIKLTIDVSSGTPQASYLFYWDALPEAAYYSAWYYFPENVSPDVWWNIMQWKSTYDHNTDNSRPIFTLDGGHYGWTGLTLCHLPDRESDRVCWHQDWLDIPRGDWFQLEVYYERDRSDGTVIVWQDGIEVFNVTGYPTVLSDGTLYYSVNNYTDSIDPDVISIYIDDVAISYDRLSVNSD